MKCCGSITGTEQFSATHRWYLGFHHRNRTVFSNTHRWDTSAVTATSRLSLRNEGEVDGELTSICTRRKLRPIRWDPAYYKTQGWSHGRHRHRASGYHLSLFPPGSSPNSLLCSSTRCLCPPSSNQRKEPRMLSQCFQYLNPWPSLEDISSPRSWSSLQPEPHGSFPEPPNHWLTDLLPVSPCRNLPWTGRPEKGHL